jgi:hypothetical protein
MRFAAVALGLKPVLQNTNENAGFRRRLIGLTVERVFDPLPPNSAINA